MPSARPVRLVAFLRAINVGGAHVVKMDALRAHFEALGFTSVETFIASGNVVFSSRATDLAAVERKIEKGLQSALGYEVKTFVRTDAEIATIAAHKPFAAAAMKSCVALNVGFLAAALDPAAVKTLMGLKTEIDDFHVNGREVYWICKKRQSESTMNNVRFEKLMKASATFRGVKTIARLLERLK
jgi:uncharacterized protein (DUF1697 family)